MINKYYVTDLAPGRSMVEHLVAPGPAGVRDLLAQPGRAPPRLGPGHLRGRRSSRRSTPRRRSPARDARARRRAVRRRHRARPPCSPHLAATGEQDRIAASRSASACSTTSAPAPRARSWTSRPPSWRWPSPRARATSTARALAGVFAWLRPNDLIWNYWVNNYLLGSTPPAFDILYWNADTTRMPAGAAPRLHATVARQRARRARARWSVLGTPVDLATITADSYLVAGIADHITPWQSCYRSTQLLGSEPRFVLSTSGHIAAMVNPPGNEKASYQVNDRNPASAPTPGWQGAVDSAAARGGRTGRTGSASAPAATSTRRARRSAAPRHQPLGAGPRHLRARDADAVVRGGPRLHCERRGRGEPLLWITGFTISAAVFEPVLPLYDGPLRLHHLRQPRRRAAPPRR